VLGLGLLQSGRSAVGRGTRLLVDPIVERRDGAAVVAAGRRELAQLVEERVAEHEGGGRPEVRLEDEQRADELQGGRWEVDARDQLNDGSSGRASGRHKDGGLT
jgi:hypothetical protein